MKRATLFFAAIAIAAPVLAQQPAGQAPGAPGGAVGAPGRGGRAGAPQAAAIDLPWNDAIPPGIDAHATRALKESTRHGEWVDIKAADGSVVKSWVTYPERTDKAGVVLVIFDIYGMRDLARAMGDQLAQDGFISIVPDFLSGKGPNGGGSESMGAGMNQAIMGLSTADVVTRLNAAMDYGEKLPASNGKTGVIGFCWGGTQSFAYAAAQPNLAAAVVFYGQAPGTTTNDATADSVAVALANVKAPVLGMYAGNDARIGATVPVTEAAMKKLGKPYDTHTFAGAGHGFMFAQAGANGANLKAAQDAWPMVLQFYRANLK